MSASEDKRSIIGAFWALARPEQWIKNGFVLLPLFFGHKLFDLPVLYATFLATLAFCFLSSAVYAVNDVVDADSDRLHPAKFTRPLAQRTLNPRSALIFAIVLIILALSIAIVQSRTLCFVLIAYTVLQLAYSLKLKRIVLLDVAAIALGFVLRILAGGIAAQVELSPWIVVMSFLLALMLALGKRHSDLFHTHASPSTSSWPNYTLHFAESCIVILATCSIVSYLLYTLSPDVLARHGSHPLYFSAAWVLFGVLRYVQLVVTQGGGGSPSRLAFTDPGILLAVLGWLGTLTIILYG